MLQIILTLVLFLVIAIPVGIYMYHIATFKHTFLDKIFDPIDKMIFKICHIDSSKGMDWKQYTLAFLITNTIMMIVGFVILKIQSIGIFNPNAVEGMETSLAFNTIVSFMTNTNLQHYAGETGLSYLSQMLVITFMMFVSAASGYAGCMAFIRGVVGKKGSDLGNFFSDLVRIITRILLPFSIVGCLMLVMLGVSQNLQPNMVIDTLEGNKQMVASGPIASLEIIKHLGTNGGGFMGANSSSPLENPNIMTNIIELFSMMILPAACVITFGKMAQDSYRERCQKEEKKSFINKFFGKEGFSVFVAMSILFVVGLGVCYSAEKAGNPLINDFVNQEVSNMEGKEVRFGIAQSSLFTTTTTSFTTGTVNNMHDSLTPIGGMVPLLHMMLNVVFGGKGVGLMNMLVYAILAVFICGLMIGRTPEYLGKKIEGREMKLAALVIIIHPLLILAFSALALSCNEGLAGISNPGFHGISQILYEYSSSAANNGSGFEGLMDNTVFWNVTTGLVMLLGRFLPIVLQLAIAGSLVNKKYVNESTGTLQTGNLSFAIILVVVVYILAALTFFPALALGPIAEYLTL